MKLLAFDTATDACTAALWIDGEVQELCERGMKHAERLLPMVERLLAEAMLSLSQLDGIAFGRGPGSFTGLRIGAGVAQGLAFGADLPVAPVSSLAALAQGVAAERVLAAFDARMQQVYWAAFARDAAGRVAQVHAEVVCQPDEVPLPVGEGEGWVGAGSGWDAYHAVLAARLKSQLTRWAPGAYPQAREVARLGAVEVAAGRGVVAEAALPVYVRDEVAVKPKNRPE